MCYNTIGCRASFVGSLFTALRSIQCDRNGTYRAVGQTSWLCPSLHLRSEVCSIDAIAQKTVLFRTEHSSFDPRRIIGPFFKLIYFVFMKATLIVAFSVRGSLISSLRAYRRRSALFPTIQPGRKLRALRVHLNTFTQSRSILQSCAPIFCATLSCARSEKELATFLQHTLFLQRRMATIRGGKVVWMYGEDTCGKQFTRQGSLRVHGKTVHKGRRDFLCGQAGCKMAFGKNRGALLTRAR